VVDRHAICALHLGIAEGLVSDTSSAVEQLVPYDPRKAGCRLRIVVRADDEAPQAGSLALRGASASRARN